jgi:pimeloyl-ACP methyl ester carboxylesterase
MVMAAPTTCVNHRRRPRAATCTACGQPICADCIVHTGVGVKCRNCTGVKAAKPGKAPPVEAVAAPPKARSGERKPWAVPVAIGGVVVLLLAAFGLMTRDSGPPATEEVIGGPVAGEAVERQSEFVGAGGLRIGGTLTLPAAGEGQAVPAVLIVPGLGALDRNNVVAATPPDAFRDALVSSVTGVGVSTPDPLFRSLSETLAQAGIASFRYDRRATKAAPLRPDQPRSFDDEVADAKAALAMLADRQELGGAPMVVLGQDTGAVVAMRAAAGNGRVRAVVAVSLPTRPLAEVLAADLARARGPAVGDALKAAAATLASTGKVPPDQTLPEIIRPIFAPGQDAYVASVLGINPTAEVGNVAVPILLVRGGADPTITEADTQRMQSSFRVGGQVMVGGSQTDHNLAIAGPDHEHSNTATTPTVKRDADAGSALASWVKLQLGG